MMKTGEVKGKTDVDVARIWRWRGAKGRIVRSRGVTSRAVEDSAQNVLIALHCVWPELSEVIPS